MPVPRTWLHPHDAKRAHLAQVCERKGDDGERDGRLSDARVVDVVGDKRREERVVREVAGEVEDRHRRVRKVVHVERLVDPLRGGHKALSSFSALRCERDARERLEVFEKRTLTNWPSCAAAGG